MKFVNYDLITIIVIYYFNCDTAKCNYLHNYRCTIIFTFDKIEILLLL